MLGAGVQAGDPATSCDEIRRAISDADGARRTGRRVRTHLRDCPRCAAFASAIPQRQLDLRALTPVLPSVAALEVLSRVAVQGTGHAGASGLGWPLGAGKTIGAALATKTLAAAAIVATAAAVVTTVVSHRSPSAVSRPAPLTRTGPTEGASHANTARRPPRNPAERSNHRSATGARRSSAAAQRSRHGHRNRAAASNSNASRARHVTGLGRAAIRTPRTPPGAARRRTPADLGAHRSGPRPIRIRNGASAGSGRGRSCKIDPTAASCHPFLRKRP
jgi:hypothetical protein